MTHSPIRYVTVSELIYINGCILENANLMSGKQKVRDLDLLQAAAQRPEASAFGEDAFRELPEKTAALLHALARNHPFTDGNKRTATVAALFMFTINGWRVNWDQAQALEIILSAAENHWEVGQLAAWLQENLEVGEPAWEAEIEKDMSLIDMIMSEQKWLLDELNKQ
ncbi:MAG: type II toxin-antitoxin system death-on-curing family toxin [Chitinophagaceae bacterium]|nr:type II toxin-antitoxin system death-on-curing family toxin [Anaerolineae bacterium]